MPPAPATSARDPRVRDLRDLQHDHRSRDARRLAVIDDETSLTAALEAGCRIELLLEDSGRAADPAPWRALLDATGSDAVPASRDALRALGATGRVPRVVASVSRPPVAADPAPGGGLALVGVSDAGDVGGIVRTAAAFGLPAVTLLDGCADPWGRKALRAAGGATFVPGLVRGTRDLRDLAAAASGPLVVALRRDGGDQRGLASDATVLLGTGAQALSRADLDLCDEAVSVSTAGSASLGVAAAAALLAHALAGVRGLATAPTGVGPADRDRPAPER